jgi:hypothetical protein
MDERNREALARWRAKWDAYESYPPPWNPIAAAWFERRLREQRLIARQWLAGIKGRRDEALAQERWFRRRSKYATAPGLP